VFQFTDIRWYEHLYNQQLSNDMKWAANVFNTQTDWKQLEFHVVSVKLVHTHTQTVGFSRFSYWVFAWTFSRPETRTIPKNDDNFHVMRWLGGSVIMVFFLVCSTNETNAIQFARTIIRNHNYEYFFAI
jgi:hypothetical protein